MYGYASGNGFVYMLLVQLLFFIATLALVVWLLKNNKSSEEILNMRLASGAITKEEHRELLQAIECTSYKYSCDENEK